MRPYILAGAFLIAIGGLAVAVTRLDLGPPPDVGATYKEAAQTCDHALTFHRNAIRSGQKQGDAELELWIADDIVCIKTDLLHKALATEFVTTVTSTDPPIQKLVISSPGGDAEAMEMMGRLIQERKMSVIILVADSRPVRSASFRPIIQIVSGNYKAPAP